MLNGYKGYTGIVISILGALNLFEKMGVTSDQVSTALDGLFQFIGIALTAWGYISAKLRLKKEGVKTDVITTAIASTQK